MNWWIIKQLRAATLVDLRDFIPQGYFESEIDGFKLHNSIANSDYYSRELKWGYLATKLGKSLFFESTALMSARQVSASEVLMCLGLFAGVETMLGATKQLAKKAQLVGVADGNAGEVAKQLEEYLPTALNNITHSLERYLRHLTPLEAQPFLPLLNSLEYKDKIVDGHPNVSLLLKRMTTALEHNDPSGVLHASASIFETIAKDVIGIDTIQNKPLGSFFALYRKDSM